MKLIKKAISLKYFSEILKFPLDLSQALYNFLSERTEPDSVKHKFYLSKIKSKNPKTGTPIVLERQKEIIENPLILETLFPFKEEKKEEHKYEKEIKIMTSNNEAYSEWVKKLIDSGKIQEEDFAKIKEFLDDFSSLINRKILTGKEADINNYADDSQLFNEIQRYKKNEKKLQLSELINNEEVKNGSEIIARKENIVVFRIDKFPAIKLLGNSTSWCVARAESSFTDYTPPFYLFYIDEEPEILVNFGSHQIKAKDDSTAFNPYHVYLIDDIIKSLAPNDFEYKYDFEEYNKIIQKYLEYTAKKPEEIQLEIEANPMNMIYVTPENYGKYIKPFCNSILSLDRYFIETFSKNFVQYLGNYLKITGQTAKFNFIENLIIEYLAKGWNHTDYFKRIPKSFHTKNVYENGYITSLKSQIKGHTPMGSYELLDSLNPSEKERPDIKEAWLEQFKSDNMTDEFYLPTLVQMISYVVLNRQEEFKTFSDFDQKVSISGRELLMGREEEIKPFLFKNVKIILAEHPNSYKEIPDEIKELKEMFEPTKKMIEAHPETYMQIPESLKYPMRFAIFNGYVDLAKKVIKEEMPYSSLDKAPLFVTRNPKYQKILERGKRNDIKELEYKFQELKKSKEFMDNPRNDTSQHGYWKRTILVNLLDGIDKKVLRDKRALPLILDFLKTHGFQYKFLPIELKGNNQIIEVASRTILEKTYAGSTVYHSEEIPKDLIKNPIFNKIKREMEDQKKMEKNLQYGEEKHGPFSEGYGNVHYDEFKKSLLYLLNNKKLRTFVSVLGKETETAKQIKEDEEFLREIFPLIINSLVSNDTDPLSSLSTYNWLSDLEDLDDIFGGRVSTDKRIQDLIIDFATKDFKNDSYSCDQIIENYPKLLSGSDKFINTNYGEAKKQILKILEYPSKVFELDNVFRNLLLVDPEIIQEIRKIAIEELNNKNVSRFVTLDKYTKGKLSQDPEILKNYGYLRDLYSSNWYAKIRLG